MQAYFAWDRCQTNATVLDFAPILTSHGHLAEKARSEDSTSVAFKALRLQVALRIGHMEHVEMKAACNQARLA